MTLSLGALGGAATFGGQAADLFCAAYDEFGRVEYFDDASSMMQAVEDGIVDAGCVPEQTSRAGFHTRSQGRVAPPDSPFYVVAEVTHAYHCSLLVRPGTELGAIRKVVGHTGSVSQGRSWLEANLPDARIEIVDTNSLGAAREAYESDGSTASVGTSDAAQSVGLLELVRDIDGGSVGNYWALAAVPRFAAEPTQLVVTARLGGDGALGDLIVRLHGVGFRLQTSFASSPGRELHQYDHVLRFTGEGRLDDINGAIEQTPAARLIGAFVRRDISDQEAAP